MTTHISPWKSPEDDATALHFLRKNAEANLFLIANFKRCGNTLGEDLSSGNFYILRQDLQIIGIFVLTRRGNLLADCPADPKIIETIVNFIFAHEKVPLRGILTQWELLQIFETILQKNDRFHIEKCVREILFSLPLSKQNQMQTTTAQQLKPKDFSAWDAAMKEFMEEEGIPLQGTFEERKTDFIARTHEQRAWGAFDGQTLVSTAGLSPFTDGSSMVGAVFTKKTHRKRGLSQSVMLKMIDDAVFLGLSKLVLFTGLHNQAAQAMYRKLGFVEIGNFGMLFGHTQEP